jgi:hypothetical protein
VDNLRDLRYTDAKFGHGRRSGKHIGCIGKGCLLYTSAVADDLITPAPLGACLTTHGAIWVRFGRVDYGMVLRIVTNTDLPRAYLCGRCAPTSFT